MGFFKPRAKEVFQRPHDYSFTIGIYANDATCISPNRLRNPVRMFLVQADLANGGIVNVGSANVSLTVGIQLDPGRAIQFAVGDNDLIGSLFPSTMNWEEAVGKSREKIIDAPPNMFLDMADFYVAGDAANQRVRVFWVTLAS